MSILSGTTEGDLNKLITQAVSLIRSKADGGENFPITNDAPDTGGELSGKYIAIEAKNILIAVMVSGLWPDLMKSKTGQAVHLPDPADMPPGYRISQFAHWPDDSKHDGITGFAVDQQANTVADVAFTQLMYKTKGAAKSHYSLLHRAADAPTEQPPDDADPMEVDQIQQVEQEQEGNQAGGQQVQDEDEATLVANALPAAFKIDKTFRLTRDWSKWPSAGVVKNEVISVTQAQYGLVADTVFETVKVQVDRQAKEGRMKIFGEKDQTAVDLAEDDGARSIYVTILGQYVGGDFGQSHTTISHDAKAEANRFLQWIEDNENSLELRYTNDADEPKSLLNEMSELDADAGGLAQFFVRACKTYEAGQGMDDASNATPSLADDASLASVRSRGGRSGRGGRGRPRGRGRGSGRATGASKRKAPSESDDSDDEEDNGSDGEDSVEDPDEEGVGAVSKSKGKSKGKAKRAKRT